MKILSLAWKYHPSVTSGLGVACEGLNNALSRIADLTVIYPNVSKVQVKEEVILSSEDLSPEQIKQIEEEYFELIDKDRFELAVRLDPYYHPEKIDITEKSVIAEKREKKSGVKSKIPIKKEKITEKYLYEEVDVFGESVRDKIYLYNRLVEELATTLSFDIIHAHDWMTFLAGIALKDRYQKPLVLHVHSLEYDRVGHKDASWVYDIERYAMSKADSVISASNYTKGIIESNYGLSGNHIHTIYNAVSLPEHVIDEPKEPGKKFRVLFVGRIDGNKGIEYFIEIARLIIKRARNVEFIIAGSGKGLVDFDKIKGFHEIRTKFNYLGFVEREDLFALYRNCDVLCMPSISEPFGLTAIEAAHVGLPVVLSRKTGASELLKRTLIADFWDTESFAHHVLSLKNNPKLRQRIIANNQKDISHLSWNSSALQVLQLFRRLLN